MCLPCHGSERDGWGEWVPDRNVLTVPNRSGASMDRGSGIISLLLRFFVISLRPIQRFLAQWVSVLSRQVRLFENAFVWATRQTSLGAPNFSFSVISSAFLAEVATLYLLGIGNLTEPHYWLFILLTSIPFVLISFLLVSSLPRYPSRMFCTSRSTHGCGSFHRCCLCSSGIGGCRIASCCRLYPRNQI